MLLRKDLRRALPASDGNGGTFGFGADRKYAPPMALGRPQSRGSLTSNPPETLRVEAFT
jgi:hypothetical protein